MVDGILQYPGSPTPNAHWNNKCILDPLSASHTSEYFFVFLCADIFTIIIFGDCLCFRILHFPNVQWPTCLQPSGALFYQYQGCRVQGCYSTGQSEDSIVTHLANQSDCGINSLNIKEHQDPGPQKCSESREKENDVIIGVAHYNLWTVQNK